MSENPTLPPTLEDIMVILNDLARSQHDMIAWRKSQEMTTQQQQKEAPPAAAIKNPSDMANVRAMLKSSKAEKFQGERSVMAVNTFLKAMESDFKIFEVSENMKITAMKNFLGPETGHWLDVALPEANDWSAFKVAFLNAYYPQNDGKVARKELAKLKYSGSLVFT